MYIKGIKIDGFKSYKDETRVEDLYNGLNVIVGRNGSGKSNVFSAIEFALTIDYSKLMKAEARSSLIYYGRSNPDPAFVEIAFDNSDRKLPIDSDNVIFRRTLAQKKDKFFVNGRELANAKQFLDAAGFTNPYFIVKQGKIHDLALATDAARLKVISDVTGANAFNRKIADCEREIEGADAKKADVQKMLQELYERRECLETEVEEQRSFMKCDQAKRAIEYILHTRKIDEIQTGLDRLEDSRQESSDRQKPILDQLEKISRDIQIYNRDVGESEARMKQLHDLKKDYESTINRMTTTLSNYNQDLEDLNAKSDNRSSNASELQQEISEYEVQSANLQSELLNMKEHMENLFYRKCQIESRVKQLHEMEMMKAKGSDRSYQMKKLKEIATDLAKSNESLSASQKALSVHKQQILDEENALQHLREEVISLNNDSNETSRKIEACKMDEQECKTLREVKWQQLGEIEQKIEQKRDHVMRLEEDWKKLVGISVLKGWKGVQKILEDFKAAGEHQDIIDGYYGLVFEIIECDPHLDVAVEVSAGKKLVHHVVESRNIAEQILHEFNSRKMPGELNFIYISSPTRAKNLSQFTDMELQGAKPIKSLLRVPEKFTTVADSVFGKTLLCKTFQIATQMMREHNVQCVTLEGEKVSKVGVMTGGYRPPRPQNFELQRARIADQKQLNVLNDMKRDLDHELAELNRKYQESKKINEKCHLQRSHIQESKRRKLTEIQNNERKIRSMYEAMQTLEKSVVDLNVKIRVLKEKESLMKNSDVSLDKVEILKDVRTVRTEYQQADNQYCEKQKEKNALDAKLRQLRNSLNNLLEASTPDGENYKRSAIKRLNGAIVVLCQQIKEVQGKLDAANQELTSLQRLVRSKRKKIEELSESEKKAKNQLMEICGELDAFSVKQACLLKKLEEQKAVGAIHGTVPANLEEFESLRDSDLYKQLKKLNIKLKDSTKKGVNQKAIQQYEELKVKCDNFELRMKSLADCGKELAKLLRDLETKKGEAMLRNVRLIQEEFGRIFQKIVPFGKAELVLYGKDVSIDHQKDIEEVELLELAGKDVFEGVKVCVNFMGQQLPNIRGLAQLSGGQKSVIALCLILAIQTIDPVPFYIFDEVDQALDTVYRDAVARVIGEMSERSQFICTTFRREFLTVADKIFGVSFNNRCSHIQPISDEEAMSFVETECNSMSIESSSISPSGSFCHSNSAA